MITHDVDEAVLLSDRIVMMTNGPAARIGEVLDVPLARPRKRLELATDADLPQVPRSACSSSSMSAIASSRPRKRVNATDVDATPNFESSSSILVRRTGIERIAKFACEIVLQEFGHANKLLNSLYFRNARSWHGN